MDFTSSFLAKKLIAAIALPPLLPLALIFLGLLLVPKFRRSGLSIAWAGLLVGLVLCTPISVNWMVTPLENFRPVTTMELRQAQAIVVLGGGQRRFAVEYRAPSTNRITLERLRYAARLQRQTGLPLLVSGGAPTGVYPEADSMTDALRNDFGVPVKWIERDSLDTADNARFSAKILADAGIRRVALVTHASHMQRAVNEFRAVGLEVIPAPTVFFSYGSNGEEFFDFVPSSNTAYMGWYALHEWLGLLAQKLRLAGEKP
jgi:uncharacterized SAM-binding protein YcdF (DUF218 family)